MSDARAADARDRLREEIAQKWGAVARERLRLVEAGGGWWTASFPDSGEQAEAISPPGCYPTEKSIFIAASASWGPPEILAKLEAEFAAGNRRALWDAIAVCAQWEYAMPPWVRRALIGAWSAGEWFEIRSWDSVFGPFRPKSLHAKTARRRSALRWPLHQCVRELSEKSGEPKDEQLFALIAKHFRIPGFGATTCKNLYYSSQAPAG
jgi:hypothetical protein